MKFTRLNLRKYGNIDSPVEISREDFEYLRKVFTNSESTMKVEYISGGIVKKSVYTYNALDFTTIHNDASYKETIYSIIELDEGSIATAETLVVYKENDKYFVHYFEV